MALDNRDASLAPQWAHECRADILRVVTRHGHEAGHFSVLGPDPWRVLFDESGEGFVAFLESSRVVIAWRSPVAPQGTRGSLYESLSNYAARTERVLFGLEVDQETCDAAVACGHTPLWTGVECYVDVKQWSLEGGRRQKLRWAKSHAAKVGVTWRELNPGQSPDSAIQLARVEREWKAERSQRSTDSFLRTDYRDLLEYRRYFGAFDDTELVAFVACTPVNDRTWYLQDPVRLPSAPRGALEGCMTLALDVFRDEGFQWVSNGPLPFWRPDGDEVPTGDLGPVARRVLARYESRFRFHGINQFRSKIDPDLTIHNYVVRSQRVISPLVARDLMKQLNRAPEGHLM